MGSVDHPAYYNQGKIEVIDFVEDQGLGFALGNAVKYVCRAAHKGDAVGDLEKAAWYVRREIQRRLWPGLTSKAAQAREGRIAAGFEGVVYVAEVSSTRTRTSSRSYPLAGPDPPDVGWLLFDPDRVGHGESVTGPAAAVALAAAAFRSLAAVAVRPSGAAEAVP